MNDDKVVDFDKAAWEKIQREQNKGLTPEQIQERQAQDARDWSEPEDDKD